MAKIVKRNKALSVSPLKSSQTIGAALAFLGMERAIPMLHGSQGCTAFGKVFFVRHFREPIPLQTTAMEQTSAVMGADENIIEGLATICGKSKPDLIGLPSTGLSETQGSDDERVVKEFYQAHPEHAHIPVIPVSTPDYLGCLESGFAKAVHNMIDKLVPDTAPPLEAKERPSLAVLVNAHMTPADIDEIKDMVEMFGFTPLVLPDISTSLDGHMIDEDFTPLTTGGTPVSVFKTLHGVEAILSFGASMLPAAELLAQRTGKSRYTFGHLMGLRAVDAFVHCLHKLSGHPIPLRLLRDRSRLQDAMLDSHFMTGFSRFAIAEDPDLLHAFTDLVTEMGGEVVAAVSPVNAPVLSGLKAEEVKIGDLEELEKRAEEQGAHVIIGNSHAVASAERLSLPILRAGFPLYDQVGGFLRGWSGYRASTQTIFDLANILMHEDLGAVKPYRSKYAQPEEAHEAATAP